MADKDKLPKTPNPDGPGNGAGEEHQLSDDDYDKLRKMKDLMALADDDKEKLKKIKKEILVEWIFEQKKATCDKIKNFQTNVDNLNTDIAAKNTAHNDLQGQYDKLNTDKTAKDTAYDNLKLEYTASEDKNADLAEKLLKTEQKLDEERDFSNDLMAKLDEAKENGAGPNQKPSCLIITDSYSGVIKDYIKNDKVTWCVKIVEKLSDCDTILG